LNIGKKDRDLALAQLELHFLDVDFEVKNDLR